MQHITIAPKRLISEQIKAMEQIMAADVVWAAEFVPVEVPMIISDWLHIDRNPEHQAERNL
ncbi:MAG: hypothetical protein GY809_10795 [Planctomycetes bacterium]|nr:hypothetical protein [Planctomycetota bacterium]